MSASRPSAANPPSVHDNVLASYTVDCSERRIVLHTVFEDREPREHTDVVFDGVPAYHFEGDTLPSIIFDIVAVTLECLYSDYENIFTRLRNHGWPPVRHNTKEELLYALHANGIQGFLLTSSYGLYGLVLAQRMELVAVAPDQIG